MIKLPTLSPQTLTPRLKLVLAVIATLGLTTLITYLVLIFVLPNRVNQLGRAPGDSPYLYSASDPGHNFAAYIGSREDNLPTVKAQFGNSSVEFMVADTPDSLPLPKKFGNKLTFKDIYPNTDLVYEMLSNGIKENFVLKKPRDDNRFRYNLTTSGTAPKLVTETGFGTTFYSAGGQYLFHLAKPFAVDASGERTDSAYFLVQASENPGEYFVDLFINNDWLQDSSRKYPITIDPTIVYNTSSLFAAGQFNRSIDTGSAESPNLATNYQELPADRYTVGLWHFNEISDNLCSVTQDVCDSSGNILHGTATGTTIDLTTPRLGTAARTFNGTTDVVTIADNDNLSFSNNTMSAEAWVKRSGNPSVNEYILLKGITTWEYAMFLNTTGTVSGRLWTSAGVSVALVTSSTVVTDGNWHHLAFTSDGSAISIYIDGKLDSVSSSFSGSMSNTAASLYFGDRSDQANTFFEGSLDEVRISNVARSASEIKLSASRRPSSTYTSDVIDFNSDTSGWNPLLWSELGVRTGDGETLKDATALIAQWNLNEASGTTATNNAGSCGASCNGTLTNFASTASRDAAARSGWTAANKSWGDGALMLDGSNDYVNVPTTAALNFGTGDFTLETWIKNVTTSRWVISKGTQSGAYRQGYGIYISGTVPTLLLDAGPSTQHILGSGVNIQDGNWHHVVGQREGTTTRIFVDGIIRNTGTSSINVSSNDPLRIGADGNLTASAYGNGTIDSTRVYSRALTAAEILSNYNAGNIELQTRVGADSSPDDGSWEPWRPVTAESVLSAMDSDASNWTWDSLTTYMPQTKTDESTIKVEGTGSLKLTTGTVQADANTVGLWHLEETGGSGAYLQDSTNNNDLTPTGTLVTNGISGKARKLNGSSEYLSSSTVTNLPSGQSARTISFWTKPTNVNPGGSMVALNNTAGSSQSFILQLSVSAGVTYLFTDGKNGGNNITLSGAEIPSPNKWHHIAFTFNGTNSWAYYLDGVLTKSGNFAVTINTVPNTLTIGRRADAANTEYYPGSIDEIQLSNVARTADEISANYRLGRDHYLNRTITSADLSSLNSLPFYLAADRPGTYLSATIGESAFANYQPDANTITLLHLDQLSGSAAYLQDSATSANHATPTGTASTDGFIGKARYYDGSADYLTLGTPASLDFGNNGAFTVDSWVFPLALKDNGTIYSKGNNRASPWSYILSTAANGRLVIYNGSAWADLCPAGSIITGKWQHIAYSYSGTTMSGYANGQLCGTASFSYTDNAAHIIHIGTHYAGDTSTDWNGLLDEVRVSNIARSAEDIRQAAEIGRRTHQITIDFGASLDEDGLIADSSDTSFIVDGRTYGLTTQGANLYKGDKIIVRENYNGTEYLAQGTVTAVTPDTGSVTVSSWDSGSTFPTGGFTVNADVFKWQREYFDFTGSLAGHRNTITLVSLRPSSLQEAHTIWLDDFRVAGPYLTDPSGSTITSSTGNRYLQFRIINTSSDYSVSPSVTAVTSDFQSLAPAAPTIGAATALSDTSIAWGFTDNASDETGFKVFDTAGVEKATCVGQNLSSCTETGLSANVEYSRKVVAYNAGGNSLYSATVSKYTLAAIPAAPAVSDRAATTVVVDIDPSTNSAATTFAIYKETGITCDGSGGSYIAANGSDNGATAVWQTDEAWDAKEVTGLSANQAYVFCVKAKNADDVETAFGPLGSHNTGYIPISGDYIFTSDTAYTSDFVTRHVDGNNAERYVLGVDNGGNPNSAVFRVQSGILTINSTDSLVVGTLELSGGAIAIADGGTIEIGKPVWAVDQDADGHPADTKLYIGNSPANGQRKNGLITLSAADCDDTDDQVTSADTLNTYYQDSDSDTFGNPNVSQQKCGTTPPVGYVSNNTDCGDGDANAKPGSSTCSTSTFTHVNGGTSYDWNCASGATQCGTIYGYSNTTYNEPNNTCNSSCNDCCLSGSFVAYVPQTTACGATGYVCGQALIQSARCIPDCTQFGSGIFACRSLGSSGTQACQ